MRCVRRRDFGRELRGLKGFFLLLHIMAQQEKYDSQRVADLFDTMPQGSSDRPLAADDPPCKYLAACWKKLDFTDEIWMMGSCY